MTRSKPTAARTSGSGAASTTEYIRIYEQYKSGQISETEAISRMSYFMALEPQAVEGGRYLTKQEVAEREWRERWQTENASN